MYRGKNPGRSRTLCRLIRMVSPRQAGLRCELLRPAGQEAKPFSHTRVIPCRFRKEIVAARFAADAKSPVGMRDKSQFPPTVCTAVVRGDHSASAMFSVHHRYGRWRPLRGDLVWSCRWGTAHCREISAELIFRNQAAGEPVASTSIHEETPFVLS